MSVNIMIAGAMKTTVTEVQYMFLDLLSLGTVVEVAALKATHHFPEPNPTTRETEHNSIWVKAVKMD